MNLEWRVIQPELRSGAEIVAIDDVLHEFVGERKSSPTLIFYHWNNVLSLGKPQAVSDVNLKKCKEYAIEVVRTTGGGRAVLHLGKRDLSYSLVLQSNGRSFDAVYEEFCGKIARALQSLNIPIQIQNKNDLYVGEQKKISGNALRHEKKATTQHGIIIYKPHPAGLMINLMDPEMYGAEDILELEKRLASVQEINPSITMQQLIGAITAALTDEEYRKGELSFAEKIEVSKRKKIYENLEWFRGTSKRGLCWLSKGEPRGSLRGH